MAERIHGFGVLTFAHTLGYLCKSSWQSARPHYLSANRGHAERQGKTLKLRSRGEEWTLSVQRFYADWSSKSSCGLQWSPQTPRLGPAHHLPSADGHSGSRCFWQIFYGNTETEIPAAASTPSVPQSRVAFAKKEEIPAPGDRRTLEIAHFDRLRNLGGRPRQGFKR